MQSGQRHRLQESCLVKSVNFIQQFYATDADDGYLVGLAKRHKTIQVKFGQFGCLGKCDTPTLIKPKCIRTADFLLYLASHLRRDSDGVANRFR